MAFELFNDASDILEFVIHGNRLTITCTDEFRQRCIAMVEMTADKARPILERMATGLGEIRFQDDGRLGGDRVVYEFTEKGYQEFAVHRSSSGRALRRFRAEWSFDARGAAKKLLAEMPAPQPTPLAATEIMRASAGGDAGVRKMAASMLPTAAPMPQPTPEPTVQASDQGRRIAELEAENLRLQQQVTERDQMIAFLRQQARG